MNYRGLYFPVSNSGNCNTQPVLYKLFQNSGTAITEADKIHSFCERGDIDGFGLPCYVFTKQDPAAGVN